MLPRVTSTTHLGTRSRRKCILRAIHNDFFFSKRSIHTHTHTRTAEGSSSIYFRWKTVLIGAGGRISEGKYRGGRKSSRREAASLVSWVKIDGHQRPWAASRLEQGIAPPRRPRYGGVTAAPQIPTLRRRRPSGRTVIRTCLRYPCEAVPHYFVIVPRGVFRGTVRSFLQSKHGTHLFLSLLFLFFFFSVSLSLSLSAPTIL